MWAKAIPVSRQPQWRVFCAIDLPPETRERVLEHIARLRQLVPQAQASWSREENIHLTLKFLGELPKAAVQTFSDAASRAVPEFAPFTILLEQTGAFPEHGLPRVLWLGVSDSGGQLINLHAQLEAESAAVGFPKEVRPFHPHLTLARLRKPQHARTLAAAHEQIGFEPVEITVSELLVVRSELRSEGSQYTVISRHALGTERGLGSSAE